VALRLFTFGCPSCRAPWREKLKQHFAEHGEHLCADCRRRLDTNVFRLLDCKEEGCRFEAKFAPTILAFLDDECRGHFEEVKGGLTAAGVAFDEDRWLIRGLDYYNRTIFEFFPKGGSGRQDALGAGGRYDGLSEQLGGPRVPAVGFALGVDRICLELADSPASRPDVYVGRFFLKGEPQGPGQQSDADVSVAASLRARGIACVASPDVLRIGKVVTAADRAGARWAVLLGGEELGRGNALVRDMQSGEQVEAPVAGVAAWLAERTGRPVG
jgi:histidyl-tRNA synthetase